MCVCLLRAVVCCCVLLRAETLHLGVLQYIEKMDLAGFVSLKDDCSRDRNLEAARFILRMKDGETKLTVLSHRHARVSERARFGVSYSFCLLPGAKPGVPGAVERLPLLCHRCKRSLVAHVICLCHSGE